MVRYKGPKLSLNDISQSHKITDFNKLFQNAISKNEILYMY